jgi:hypothetical protein
MARSDRISSLHCMFGMWATLQTCKSPRRRISRFPASLVNQKLFCDKIIYIKIVSETNLSEKPQIPEQEAEFAQFSEFKGRITTPEKETIPMPLYYLSDNSLYSFLGVKDKNHTLPFVDLAIIRIYTLQNDPESIAVHFTPQEIEEFKHAAGNKEVTKEQYMKSVFNIFFPGGTRNYSSIPSDVIDQVGPVIESLASLESFKEEPGSPELYDRLFERRQKYLKIYNDHLEQNYKH